VSWTNNGILAAIVGVTPSCGGVQLGPREASGEGQPVKQPVLALPTDPPAGLDTRLSEADAQPAHDAPVTRPAAKKLNAAATEALLSRLPSPTPDADDQQAFKLRAGSPPPPRTGETRQHAFPPRQSAQLPRARAGPSQGVLQVTRVSPQGEVPIAAHLSVPSTNLWWPSHRTPPAFR